MNNLVLMLICILISLGYKELLPPQVCAFAILINIAKYPQQFFSPQTIYDSAYFPTASPTICY